LGRLIAGSIRKSIGKEALSCLAGLYSVAISQFNQCSRDGREPIAAELSRSDTVKVQTILGPVKELARSGQTMQRTSRQTRPRFLAAKFGQSRESARDVSQSAIDALGYIIIGTSQIEDLTDLSLTDYMSLRNEETCVRELEVNACVIER